MNNAGSGPVADFMRSMPAVVWVVIAVFLCILLILWLVMPLYVAGIHKSNKAIVSELRAMRSALARGNRKE